MRGSWILTFTAIPLVLSYAFAGTPDPYMGDWKGTVQTNGKTQSVAVYMIPYGNGWYEMKIVSAFNQRVPTLFHLRGRIQNEIARFVDLMPFDPTRVIGTTDRGVVVDASLWEGKISHTGTLTLQGTIAGRLDGRFRLEKFQRVSPTLGAKPPPNAIVLFDGTNLNEWEQADHPGKKPNWKILPGGILEVGKGNIRTKRTFRDFFLHLEFRTPYMPFARGQARGNSGVYLQGRYEVQVLDSYGLVGEDNECGGIYHVARPRVNMCFPSLQWQTYDITFRAARFDASGKKIANARVTVLHNGVVVHKDRELPGPTPGALDQNEAAPGPILLQDHGNPVQYRNIWIVEK